MEIWLFIIGRVLIALGLGTFGGLTGVDPVRQAKVFSGSFAVDLHFVRRQRPD